jgi:hypothetical protein
MGMEASLSELAGECFFHDIRFGHGCKETIVVRAEQCCWNGERVFRVSAG